MKICTYKPQYLKEIIDILNFYIENTDFTFIPSKISYNVFDNIIELLGNVLFLLAIKDDKLVGFICFKKTTSNILFSQSCELGIYIHPNHTQQNIGSSLLNTSQTLLQKQGISNIVSTIHTQNQNSIDFHKKNNFTYCGTISNVGQKNGVDFSLCIYQKQI